MKTWKWIAAAVGLIAVAVLATVDFSGSQQEIAEPVAPSAKAKGAPVDSLTWIPGKRYVYDVTLSGNQQVILGESQATGPMNGSISLGATAWLEPTVAADGRLWVRFRLPEVSDMRLEMLGSEVIADAEAGLANLDGQSAWLSVDASGSFDATGATDSPTLIDHLATLFAREFQVHLPPVGQSAVTLVEHTERGAAISEIRAAEVSGQTAQFLRERPAYDRLHAADWRGGVEDLEVDLESQARIGVRRDGTLVSLESSEHVVVTVPGKQRLLDGVSKSSLRLVRTEDAPSAVALGLPSDRRSLDAVQTSAAADRRALQQRVGEHSWREVADGMSAYASGGEGSAFQRWLWQTVGLLRLHPELCRDLAALAMGPDASSGQRALAADLLAGTGHAEAQAALREILGSEAVHASDETDRALLHQRLAFVADPEPETVAYAKTAYAAESGTMKLASAHTLGSLAQGLAKHGDALGAEELVGEMVAALAEAPSAELQTALIRGLGNAGAVTPELALAEWSAAESLEVRAAVASALRDPQSEEAVKTLVDLAADASAVVQKEALGSLTTSAIPLSAVDSVVESVLAGQVDKSQVLQVISFVEAHVFDPTERQALAHHLIQTAAHTPEIEARLRTWL